MQSEEKSIQKLLWQKVWQVLAAIGFLLVVWWVAYLAVGNELLIPKISDSVDEIGELLVTGVFWRGLAMSLLRALFAFVLSFLTALFFALVAYLYPSFVGFITPIVSALRSLPVLAVLLILLSFLGAGEAPIAVAFLSLFPMLYTGILTALSSVDKQYFEMAKLQGASVGRRIVFVCLPLSSPYILREAGAALSFSLKLVVSAEVLANTAKSLGGMMQEAKIYAEIPQLFALVAASFIVGLVLELCINLLAIAVEKRVK